MAMFIDGLKKTTHSFFAIYRDLQKKSSFLKLFDNDQAEGTTVRARAPSQTNRVALDTKIVKPSDSKRAFPLTPKTLHPRSSSYRGSVNLNEVAR